METDEDIELDDVPDIPVRKVWKLLYFFWFPHFVFYFLSKRSTLSDSSVKRQNNIGKFYFKRNFHSLLIL